MKIRNLTEKDNSAIARIIRYNLKKYRLDIPGTAYFDSVLDNLFEYYDERNDKRAYYVLVDDNDVVVGGVGFSEVPFMENTAELQKVYLSDEYKGKGLGKELLLFAMGKAKEYGYGKMYIETHTNLDVAIKLYEKCGFRKIEKPKQVNHSTMNVFLIREI